MTEQYSFHSTVDCDCHWCVFSCSANLANMNSVKVRVDLVAIAIIICGVITTALIFSTFSPRSTKYKSNYEIKLIQDGFNKLQTLGNDDVDYGQDKDEQVVNVRVKVKNVSIFEDETLEQNDASIISYIQKWHLHPPSPRHIAHNLNGNWNNPSQMASTISQIFKTKRNGIFIEAGACDGEFFSNTLDLERNHNWTGLLVEPNSFLLTKLLGKNRKAWISDSCLSVVLHPQQVTLLHRTGSKTNTYKDWFIGNGIMEPFKDVPAVKDFDRGEYVSAGKTECFPLYSILLAINITKIDFFSLDVEGVEMKILKTIPFDLVDIGVVAVEFNVISEGAAALKEFMESKGYTSYMATTSDYVFIKNNTDYAVAGAGLKPATVTVT